MTVRELLKMPAAEIALLMYRRAPAKMFAAMRAMEELAANVAKPENRPSSRSRTVDDGASASVNG
jgi:hypothetical protein